MQFDDFNPEDYPDLFEIAGDRIVYKKANRTGVPKSYSWTDPEEPVRAWFYASLILDYDYPAERLDLEVEVFRRQPVDYADIVVYRDDQFLEPFLVVECKRPRVTEAEFEQGMKQAWGNANNLRAEYACATDSTKVACFEASRFDPKNPRNRLAKLPKRYGKPVVFAKIKDQGDADLVPASQETLNSKFRACHDILWEGGKRNPAEAFDEMTKLLFCKLQDERIGTPDGKAYRFQIGSNEAPSEVGRRVRAIWADYRSIAQPVFSKEISVSDDLIYRVAEILQNYSLSRSDLDAKGKAFETFLPTVFRGDMGQYFTPRPVVRFMVELANPTIKDKLIDPACGSGGFLLFALERMQKEAEAKFKDPKERQAYWLEWAQRCLFGIEINDQISRVAMMGMILHEDGRTNVACHDALAPFGVRGVTPAFYEPSTFSLVLTNPPFGSVVKRVAKGVAHPTLDNFELGKHKKSRKTEMLFVERCLDLLRPGGRLGIILPEGILNNDQTRDVRELVEDRAFIDAVISLPVETFMFSKAYVKSSIVFFRKFTDAESKSFAKVKAEAKDRSELRRQLSYPIFLCHVDDVGITATGQEAPDALPEVVSAYRQFRKENPLGFRGRGQR